MQHNGNGNDAPGQNKVYSIIVNARPREVSENKLTYLQVVQLAYRGEVPSQGVVYTVTFSNPHGHDGIMTDGDKVKIHNGMVFNVRKTDQS